LKISVLVAAVEGVTVYKECRMSGKMTVLLRSSIVNGGAILSFSQLQEEVPMKGSILYLIMSCCRPIVKLQMPRKELLVKRGRRG